MHGHKRLPLEGGASGIMPSLKYCECGCGEKCKKSQSHFAAGHNSRTEHPRGMQGKTHSATTKLLIGKASTGRPSPRGMLGKQRSPETLLKQSRTMTSFWQPNAERVITHRLNSIITEIEFWYMYDSQEGACGLCFEPFTRVPHVDHDHKTGEVRWLLCFSCNSNWERIFKINEECTLAYA